MIGAMDCRFDVGDEGVHPLEQTDLAGLARADDDRSVFGHTGPGGIEAGQPIGDQVNTLVQGRSGPPRQAGLKLDRVLGHRKILSDGCHQYSTPPGGSSRETVAEFRHLS